ncbi:hypothetical protein Tco_0221579 [Tanacetum coccineum]
MDYQCTQLSEIEICRQAEEIERQRESKERNRVHEETMQMLREMIKIQDEKRIAIEKEAAELEAKRKSQECLNIEEKSIPQASIRSRKSRIDPTLRNFTISTKRIPFSTAKTVNSLKMGDKHLDTQKGSLESSVKDPIPIPSESDVISTVIVMKNSKNGLNLKSSTTLGAVPFYDENNKIRECYMIRPSAITPDLPIPDSLIMEDEHLDTIPVTESANTIKSSVDDLVPTPSEFARDLSYGEIVDTDSEPDEEIRLAENLSYDNSSPRPPGRNVILEIADNALSESLPLHRPIPIDDYDSEGDICFLEELLSNDSPPLPENESFSLDHFDDPSLPRPPPEPPDVEICFNFEPDAGVVTKKVGSLTNS